VVIVIADSASMPFSGRVDARLSRNIGKGASGISIKSRTAVCSGGQKKVGPAIAVEVDETGAATGKLLEPVLDAGRCTRRASLRRQRGRREAHGEILRRDFCAAGRLGR